MCQMAVLMVVHSRTFFHLFLSSFAFFPRSKVWFQNRRAKERKSVRGIQEKTTINSCGGGMTSNGSTMAASSHHNSAPPYSGAHHSYGHSSPTVVSPMVSVASASSGGSNNGSGNPIALHCPPPSAHHLHQSQDLSSPHGASALSPNAHHQFFGPHAAAAAAAAALSAAYRKQNVAANMSPASASLLEHSIKSMSANYGSHSASMLTPTPFAHFPNAFPIRELSVAYPHLFPPNAATVAAAAAAHQMGPFGNPFFNPYASNSFQSLLATLSSSSHSAKNSKPLDESKMHPLHFSLLDSQGNNVNVGGFGGGSSEDKVCKQGDSANVYQSDDSSDRNESLEKQQQHKQSEVEESGDVKAESAVSS